MLKRYFYICLTIILFGFTNIVSGKTLIYQEANGMFKNEINEMSSPDGYTVKTINNSEDVMEYYLDHSCAIINWEYSNEKNGTKITGQRFKNEIKLNGQFKGKKLEKVFKIDDYPWVQEWGLGLKPIALKDELPTYFWSIDPGNVKSIAKFKVVKKGQKPLILEERTMRHYI